MNSRCSTPLGSKVPDYVVSNINIFTQNWIKDVESSRGVYKVFNERYFETGSTGHLQNDRLTFSIKVSASF